MPDTSPPDEKSSPKQRIQDAAIELFADQGYAATGVREIARTAGVNAAMINYYYGSKINLLKTIFERAITVYGRAIEGQVDRESERSLHVEIKSIFTNAFKMMRVHEKLFRVTWSELHHEVPEIAEFKAGLIRRSLLPPLWRLVERHSDALAPGLRPEMIFPLLPGVVAWHFMIAPVYTRVMGLELDDAFYDAFVDQLTRIMLDGLRGGRNGDEI